MTFIWPIMLISLVLLPGCAVLYLRAQRRRAQLTERLRGFGTAGAGAHGPGWRRHLAPALFGLALALLALATARPQARVSLPRLEGTVMLVFDVSASMAAADMTPSRLAVARAVADSFVRRQPASTRLGVVAFSDGGLAVQVPTSDRSSVLTAIGRLRPQRGTSVGSGLLAALNTLAAGAAAASADGEAPARLPATAIILFSDGENNADPDPAEIAALAAERGVPIYTVGVGSPTGATLQLDGFSVHSQLNAAALQQIAELSGGAYASADAAGLPTLERAVTTQLIVRPEESEITALFVGASLVLLVVGGLSSFIWFGRLA